MVDIPGYTEYDNLVAKKQGFFSFCIMTVIFVTLICCIIYLAVVKEKELELYLVGIIALICMIITGYVSLSNASKIQKLSEAGKNSNELIHVEYKGRRNGYIMTIISIVIVLTITYAI